MASKHIPLRTCVGCRRQLPQAEMTRFVREGSAWIRDGAKRGPGRGAYLCSVGCIAKVAKNRRYPGLANAADECGLISSSVSTRED